MKAGFILKRMLEAISLLAILGFSYLFFTIGQYFLWPVRAVMYPLHTAITYDWQTVAKVLSYTPMIEAHMKFFPEGCSKPIDQAAYSGSIEMMDILLDRGADIKGCSGRSILHIAVDNDQPEMLHHLLVNRKLDPNFETYYGPPIFQTLYRCSAPDGTSLRSLEILLQNGADPNYRRHTKYLPVSGYILAEAASKPCIEMVHILLEHNADPKLVAQDIRSYAFRYYSHTEPDLDSMDRNVREAYIRGTPSRLAKRAKIEEAVRLIEAAAKE